MKAMSLAEAYSGNDDCLMDTEEGLEIHCQMQQIGNWRGLFDFFSSEWNDSDILLKWKMIEKLKRFFECDFGGLVYLYIKDAIHLDKLHLIPDVPYSVQEYAKRHREAEDYLKKCKHPAFLKVSSVTHWKGKLLDRINLCYSEDSLDLLLV